MIDNFLKIIGSIWHVWQKDVIECVPKNTTQYVEQTERHTLQLVYWGSKIVWIKPGLLWLNEALAKKVMILINFFKYQRQIERFLPLDKDSIKCYENGVEYENDEEVPSNDPCKSCHCYSGEVLCSIEDCAFPPFPDPALRKCKTMPPKEGSCCPEFYCRNISQDEKPRQKRT